MKRILRSLLSLASLFIETMSETAKDKLKKLIAWDIDPALTEDEVDELLGQSSVADSLGNAPSVVDWAPTYDLNSAAAAGWLIKGRPRRRARRGRPARLRAVHLKGLRQLPRNGEVVFEEENGNVKHKHAVRVAG